MLSVRFRFILALGVFFCTPALGRAEHLYTQEFWLKSTDVASITQAINIVVRDPSHQRIIGGQGKHLVVTDTGEEMAQIGELLPVMDQPSTETNPHRIVLEMVGRAGVYLHNNLKEVVATQKSKTPAGSEVHAPVLPGPIHTYDLYKTTSSIYAQEDARILKQLRRIDNDPVLPSISNLTLKGIFQSNKGGPLALLSYEGRMFVARDGGLFENNHSRVKAITSKVLKDRVLLTGPDHIPRTIQFKSTL